MPALIDLRRRIRSVRNTQQITQAMKTVATAKFKKAQRTVLKRRPYWHNYPDLISEVTSWAPESCHPLLEKREEKKIAVVIVTSDKGLCSAFNSNLMEETRCILEEKAKGSKIRLVLIGKKAVLYFKKLRFPVGRSYVDYLQKFTDKDLEDLAQYLMRLYVLNKIDAVYVAYNEFKSILAPRVSFLKVLPIDIPDKKKEEGKGSETIYSVEVHPDWEPGMIPLLNTLLPLYVEKQVYHCFFESLAAEQAARMMAMDSATQNAEDLIADLTLVLNKVRQASITKELLEIMSAVEALA
ncbi:MAG: ATP synthase F1 subunit gamma, partial [Acidobacteriota bacterium]|nr:ATP synthase F1 subunit gamma [Acidobacteriota bacterium]